TADGLPVASCLAGRSSLACPAGTGGAGRRRPGVGRMTVLLSSSGSAKGLSLIFASHHSASTADRPKLDGEIWKVAGDVHCEASGGFQLLPVRRIAVEFEVAGAGVERQLPGRDRQGPYRDPRQGDIHQFADMLHRADLDLGGE